MSHDLVDATAELLIGSLRIALKEPDERTAKMLIAALAAEFKTLAETLWDQRHHHHHQDTTP